MTRTRTMPMRGALLFALIVLFADMASSGELLPKTHIGRAISIHGTLNWPAMTKDGAPRYVWPPFRVETHPLASETLLRLKSAGFDTIRLTVGLGIFLSADPVQSDELDEIVIDRVQRILDAGLNVIIDFHPVGQDPRFPPLAFTRGPGEPLVEAFRALLVRTAKNLARLPQDRIVLEILNEPETRDWSTDEAALWRRTQTSYFSSVREVAPDLTLMVTGCCACCGLELTTLDPYDYPGGNVYFTFHFYAPHAFTHQGVLDRNRPLVPTRFLRNVPFPLDADSIVDVERHAYVALDSVEAPDMLSKARARRTLEQAIARLRQFPTPSAIEDVFDRVLQWGNDHDVSASRIFLGEFGVMRPNVDPSSRRRWLESVRVAAERRRMPWAYWSLEQPEYMGLSLDQNGRALDPLILEALGLRRSDEP